MYKERPDQTLLEYWRNSNVMRERAELLYEDADEDFDPSGEYRTYYIYWLATLYVVIEGFEELQLRDPLIDDIVARHKDSLRLFRNSAFHFQRNAHKFLQFHDDDGDRLRWAEDVHDAFAEYFRRHGG